MKQRMTRRQQLSKREKLDMLTWNRRLSKAGSGVNRATHHGPKIAIPPDPSLAHLQVYRVRKARTNGYRTAKKFSDEMLPETTFWVQDTRTGERVTDPAILADVLRVVNNAEKWPHVDLSYKRGAVRFDKTGPKKLHPERLGHCSPK